MGQEATMMKFQDMKKISAVCRFSIGMLAVAGFALAQDQTPHAWRSVDDPPPAAQDQSAPDQFSQAAPPPAFSNSPQGGGQAAPAPYPGPAAGPYPTAAPYPSAAPPPPNYNVPARLTIKPGTYVTIRTNQWLSSDQNHVGDTFTGTLEQPVIVDGIVVAQRGQSVYGRVTEAQKAGRVEGTSRLGMQLTDLTLVDGQQQIIQSQMINRSGPTSNGRDAAAIGGTTALGAAIGAGVDWGRGAAIGAGAGAAAGIIGVLLTRGHPTVVYPETVMTFQTTAPAIVATDRSPQAFQPVNTQPDYGPAPPPAPTQGATPPAVSCYNCGAPPPAPAPYPAPYYAPYPYPYAYGYPYPFYGGFSVVVGPRYGYYGRYGYGYRGVYRR
jgi:hypothetical protein